MSEAGARVRRPVGVRLAVAVGLAVLMAAPAGLTLYVGYTAGLGLGWLAGLVSLLAVHLLVRILWGGVLGKFLPLVILAQLVLTASAGTLGPNIALRLHGDREQAKVILANHNSGTHGGSTDYSLLTSDLDTLDLNVSGSARHHPGDAVTVLTDPHGRIKPQLADETRVVTPVVLEGVILAALLLVCWLIAGEPYASERATVPTWHRRPKS